MPLPLPAGSTAIKLMSLAIGVVFGAAERRRLDTHLRWGGVLDGGFVERCGDGCGVDAFCGESLVWQLPRARDFAGGSIGQTVRGQVFRGAVRARPFYLRAIAGAAAGGVGPSKKIPDRAGVSLHVIAISRQADVASMLGVAAHAVLSRCDRCCTSQGTVRNAREEIWMTTTKAASNCASRSRRRSGSRIIDDYPQTTEWLRRSPDQINWTSISCHRHRDVRPGPVILS